MTDFADLECAIGEIGDWGQTHGSDPSAKAAVKLVVIGEAIIEAWVRSRGEVPTTDTKEGFRLLALHRQGARGEPSFNACRETCREVAYHYNLVTAEPDHPDTGKRLRMMGLVVRHLLLFVQGKLENAGLGEFCCSAKPMRQAAAGE